MPSDPTLLALQALLARVEGATEGDRELDAEILSVLEGGEVVWKTANYTMEPYPALRRPSKDHIGGFANEHVPLVTASVDAALALIERRLPGWEWAVRGRNANVSNDGFVQVVFPAKAATPALALLAALLRAEIARS